MYHYNAVRFFKNNVNSVHNYDVIFRFYWCVLMKRPLILHYQAKSLCLVIAEWMVMRQIFIMNVCIRLYTYILHIYYLYRAFLYMGVLQSRTPPLCSLSFCGLSRIIYIMPISHSNHPFILYLSLSHHIFCNSLNASHTFISLLCMHHSHLFQLRNASFRKCVLVVADI